MTPDAGGQVKRGVAPVAIQLDDEARDDDQDIWTAAIGNYMPGLRALGGQGLVVAVFAETGGALTPKFQGLNDRP